MTESAEDRLLHPADEDDRVLREIAGPVPRDEAAIRPTSPAISAAADCSRRSHRTSTRPVVAVPAYHRSSFKHALWTALAADRVVAAYPEEANRQHAP